MLALKQKQKEAIDLLSSPEVDTLFLIGVVGSGKTVVAAHSVISICHKYKNTYWPAWRKNNTVSRKTLIKSYFQTLSDMNFVEGEDYSWHDRDLEIRFPNNSAIGFSEADVTKDKDQKKIKGVNATGSHIDEADELDFNTFTMITSRKGRRNGEGQPSKNIVTMNPNDGWAKKLVYDRWKDGILPKGWAVVEFTIADSWLSDNEIRALMTNPKWWVERYLMNNWDYADESNSLFRSKWFAEAMTNVIDGSAKRSSALDVALKRGGDRAVDALWQGMTLTDIQILKDKDEETDTDQLARDHIKFNEDNQVGYTNSAVDAVGVGAGVIGTGKSLGHIFFEYVSGSKPMENLSFADNPTSTDFLPKDYDMLRSQAIHLFALALEKGYVKIYEGCPWIDELQSEAMLHNYETTGKQMKIESKDSIKKRLGMSPDIFDAVIMGFLMQLIKQWKATSVSDIIMV